MPGGCRLASPESRRSIAARSDDESHPCAPGRQRTAADATAPLRSA
ncbi:hypothetical protein I549_5243 [Mycobacterium avium subsp. avium 2285 (R)]|nr:hypothetical protein I549_5243 [Mycobacterium avium subsp. avium 2285 (R)]